MSPSKLFSKSQRKHVAVACIYSGKNLEHDRHRDQKQYRVRIESRTETIIHSKLDHYENRRNIFYVHTGNAAGGQLVVIE
ncbi:hypothetical protein EVAR_76635_1 [Eumeta japonica]|uniref:Uncharacterized protein n=1 Tax=Eumeta variegata TaxID=151549 RepID=A0A4C1T8P4_EUMVA|nr:hypothetical protein EVAR_76635_1 [Eumeta japonica]